MSFESLKLYSGGWRSKAGRSAGKWSSATWWPHGDWTSSTQRPKGALGFGSCGGARPGGDDHSEMGPSELAAPCVIQSACLTVGLLRQTRIHYRRECAQETPQDVNRGAHRDPKSGA